MFKRRTLFVVGAGASQEVDFPTGPGLAQMIADNMKPHDNDHRGTTNFTDKGLYTELRRHVGVDKDFNPHVKAARRIHEGIELTNSVDDFLNVHRDDPLIVKLAKAAIVRAILHSERHCSLFVDQSNTYNRVDFRKVALTWFVKLMRVLAPGSGPRAAEEAFLNVSFIVFNYDRCLEHFLEHAICALYGLTRRDAATLVRRLTIIHPYGTIGDLESLPFGGAKDQFPELLPLATRIKTYAESFEDSTELVRIREGVEHAQCIVFLGFAYLEQNMMLLKPEKKIDRKPVFGTAFGMSDHDRDVVKEKIVGMFTDAHRDHALRMKLVELNNEIKCAQLFDYYARSLNVA